MPTKLIVPPIMTCWLVLLLSREMVIGVLAWKPWAVKVTLSGMAPAVKVGARLLADSIMLPPLAMPPLVSNVPPKAPIDCRCRTRLTVSGSNKSKLLRMPPAFEPLRLMTGALMVPVCVMVPLDVRLKLLPAEESPTETELLSLIQTLPVPPVLAVR